MSNEEKPVDPPADGAQPADPPKKDEENKLKIIFFYQKWSQIEPSKKEKLRLSLQLFKIYY